MNEQDETDNNVVVSLKDWEKNRDKKPSPDEPPSSPREPMFNIAPGVMALLVTIGSAHIMLEILAGFDPNLRVIAYGYLGFVPGQWTGNAPFDLFSVTSLLTYNFVHGGWLHIGMNLVMLLAFGSGVEKAVGRNRLWLLFFLSSIAGALAHLVFHLGSIAPIIGASAGVSGLFGAVIMLMYWRGMLGAGRYGVWPFIALWIGISVFFGMASPVAGDAQIAWIAHIGGFLAGLGLIRLNYFSPIGNQR